MMMMSEPPRIDDDDDDDGTNHHHHTHNTHTHNNNTHKMFLSRLHSGLETITKVRRRDGASVRFIRRPRGRVGKEGKGRKRTRNARGYRSKTFIVELLKVV